MTKELVFNPNIVIQYRYSEMEKRLAIYFDHEPNIVIQITKGYK